MSHTHDGKPCTGHGSPNIGPLSQPSMGSHSPHSHTHDGKPCTGHGNPNFGPPPSHTHDGKPCTGHGSPNSHSHDHQNNSHDTEEALHFSKILNAFKHYLAHSIEWEQNLEASFNKLPPSHVALLPDMPAKFDNLTEAIKTNFAFIQNFISGEEIFVNQQLLGITDEDPPSASDMEKVKSTIRQVVREWSKEGSKEREMCYSPILEELDRYFPDESKRKSVRVLCPGSGLGRLCYEIAKKGFASQGNEFSYFMLIASNFLLNKSTKIEQFKLYPFIHQTSNVISDQDQLREILVPDEVPSLNLAQNSDFSMSAGDFLQIYNNPQYYGAWDCVTTCYFIDTAHNIISYIEAIAKIIKPGGIWINFGPLLYHWAEMEGEFSIELSYESVKKVILSLGFTFEKDEMRKSVYTFNSRSMIDVTYNCSFFVARKK